VTEQENLQLVQQGYQSFEQGDLAAVLSNFAPDAELVYASPKESIAFAGTHRGIDAITKYFILNNELVEFEQLNLTDLFAKENKVVVLGVARIKSKKTGKVIETEFAHVFLLQDGKVMKYQVIDDTAEVAAALN
jgi:uncharacterized protein